MASRPTWVPPMLSTPVARAQPHVTSTTPARVVRLRPAQIRDIPTLIRWDNEPHIAQISGTDGPVRWGVEISRAHSWQKILLAELSTRDGEAGDARAIGVVIIIDPAEEETGYWAPVAPNLRAIDIWIGEKDCLARGYGTCIMSQALAMCFGEGCDAVLVDPLVSNVRAHKFYRRMGFSEIGVRQFGGDTCLVHRIERGDYERGEAA